MFDFSPVCVFKCFLKMSEQEDLKSHWLYLYDFPPVYIRCVLKSVTLSGYLCLFPMCVFRSARTFSKTAFRLSVGPPASAKNLDNLYSSIYVSQIHRTIHIPKAHAMLMMPWCCWCAGVFMFCMFFFIFLCCLFTSKRLHMKIYSHIDCICVTFSAVCFQMCPCLIGCIAYLRKCNYKVSFFTGPTPCWVGPVQKNWKISHLAVG